MTSYSLDNIDIDSRSKIALDGYLQRIDSLKDRFKLEIDLSSIILSCLKGFSSNHVEALLSDTGHGLEHAIRVTDCALSLSEKYPIKKDSLAIACLFHDFFGVQAGDGVNLFDRSIHAEKGAAYVLTEFKDVLSSLGISSLDLKTIGMSILSHGDKCATFIERFKDGLGDMSTAKYLKDADRLIEGSDVKRILSISERLKKPLIKKSITRLDRILFLLIDNIRIIESEHTDLLFFLSRNITINLDQNNYITDEAKSVVGRKSFEAVLQEIISSLRDFPYNKYLGDAISLSEGLKESELILRDLKKAYSQIGCWSDLQGQAISMTKGLDADSYDRNKGSILSWLRGQIDNQS